MAYGETFKLDSDGDLSITSERIDMVDDSDKVQQDLRILLQTIIGENILHRSMGFLMITDDKSYRTEKGLEAHARNTLKQYHYEIIVNKVTIVLDSVNRTAAIELEITLSSGVVIEVSI